MSVPVLDAHLHVWDRTRFDYPWMAGRTELPESSMPGTPGFPDRGVGTADVGSEGSAIFVEAGVAPEQRQPEVDWVAENAEAWGIAGIVAAVDLADRTGLQRSLDRLAAMPRVVGVRDNFEGLPSGALADRREGALAVLAAGLRIDVCIRHEQVDEVHAWLSAIAEERGSAAGVVLDHIAKPRLEDLDGQATPAAASAVIARVLHEWLPGVRLLARLPGLHAKFSGVPGQVSGAVSADTAFRLAEAFGPALLDEFGTDRTMFGSDHPVSTVAHGLDYPAWLDAVAAVLDDHLAADEKADVLAGNATRFYGICAGNVTTASKTEEPQ